MLENVAQQTKETELLAWLRETIRKRSQHEVS